MCQCAGREEAPGGETNGGAPPLSRAHRVAVREDERARALRLRPLLRRAPGEGDGLAEAVLHLEALRHVERRREHGALQGAAAGDRLGGVHGAADGLAEEALDGLDERRGAAAAADDLDGGDVVDREACVGNRHNSELVRYV